MYLLYTDESDTTENRKTLTLRWLCIAGLLVVDRSYRLIQERFEKLLKNHNLPDNFEIKGSDLYNRTGHWKNTKPQERIDFWNEVCQFIRESKFKIFSALGVIQNNDHITSYKELLGEVLDMTASHVSKRGSKTGRQLTLIFDERPDIESEIREQIKLSRKEIISKFNRSCSFIDYGFDGDSKLCWGIQIADFVAYFLRKRQAFQRENNLFDTADRTLSIEKVDELLESIKKQCKTKFLDKKSY